MKMLNLDNSTDLNPDDIVNQQKEASAVNDIS